MAKAGFLNCKDEEKTKKATCFLCSFEIESWSPKDDPFIIHLEQSPDCYYAQNVTGPDHELTLRQYFTILNIMRFQKLVGFRKFDFYD